MQRGSVLAGERDDMGRREGDTGIGKWGEFVAVSTLRPGICSVEQRVAVKAKPRNTPESSM